MLLYTMKNRRHKLASYSHTFYSQSAEGVALLYSASSFKARARVVLGYREMFLSLSPRDKF